MQSSNPAREARAARFVRALVLLALVAGLAGSATVAGAADSATQLSGVVNVNTATGEQLAQLPGIGGAKAQAILETRERLGGFDAIEDLLEVKGIGEKALARIRPYVSLQGKTTFEMQ